MADLCQEALNTLSRTGPVVISFYLFAVPAHGAADECVSCCQQETPAPDLADAYVWSCEYSSFVMFVLNNK